VSVFTEAEIDHLNVQLLGRLATASTDDKPHVVPVSFSYNADLETIDIGGYDLRARKKYRDVQRNAWAATVIDDLVSTHPWTPRMIEIRGRAEAVGEGGAALRPGFDKR